MSGLLYRQKPGYFDRMNTNRSMVVTAIEQRVIDLLNGKLDERFVYHNLQHTLSVQDACQQLADKAGLAEADREVLELAGLLHDTGFTERYEGHEEVSCRIARELLTQHSYPDEKLNQVLACITATRLGAKSEAPLELLMRDADQAHLAADDYPLSATALREEWRLIQGLTYTDNEWNALNHRFFKDHSYCTESARELWDKKKNANQKALKKLAKVTSEKAVKEDVEPNEVDHITASRSAQMMFKTSLRNHIDLSNLADNKANIMLSINAIIITIAMPLAANYITDNPYLLVPMLVLLCTCLVTMSYATMATRPTKMTGMTSDEAIQKGQANLFFFGNFFKMSFEEYSRGMQFIVADENRLDSAILRDLYFLGQSLGRKYTQLRTCYTVFLSGIGATVVTFVLSYLIAGR